MKRLCLMLSMACASLFAQAQGGASFGLKGGLNFANTSGSLAPLSTSVNFSDPQIRGSWTFGLYSRMQLSKGVRFQPELLYSGEGSIIDGPLGANNTMVNVFKNKLSYLNIPLMLHISKGTGFFVEAGPQLGFRLSAKYTFLNPPNGPSSETDMKDKTKGSAFSLAGGLGYDFDSGLGLCFRYTFGLGEINTAGSSLKSTVISATLTYALSK